MCRNIGSLAAATIFALLFTSIVWADVPAPPVNQILGLPDVSWAIRLRLPAGPVTIVEFPTGTICCMAHRRAAPSLTQIRTVTAPQTPRSIA